VADRRAPANGYDFGAKRQYRRDVYAGFKRRLNGHVGSAKHLLMPSIEGDEIEAALAAGYREENLYIVDRNPAIVATLKRRYKKATAYGIDLLDVPARLEREGVVLTSANLDLCSCVTGDVVRVLYRFARMSAQCTDLCLCVTVLRGRERGDWWGKITDTGPRMQIVRVYEGGTLDPRLTESDMGRLAMIWAPLHGSDWQGKPKAIPVLHRASFYRSHKSTMLWSAWTLEKP
jgi:hypothetical protein